MSSVGDAVAETRGRSLTKDKLASLGTNRLASLLLDVAHGDERLLERLWQAVGTPAEDGPAGEADAAPPHMVGTSQAMRAAFNAIRKYATTDAPVLITGESGTGKELVALAIHERSVSKAGPFAPINCAALPPMLIASELFGHEKGAFTGAYQRKIGRIEAAKGGTLFLDEIGDLPLEMQVHLLRFLQEKTIDRVGGRGSIRVDVRVIAATNDDLNKAVAEGRFREDLFFRLNVLCLEMPPLRARGDDVDLLSTYFLRKFNEEMNRPDLGFDESARRAIRGYRWPGNVRELISCVRRGVVMAEGDKITLGDLSLPEGGEKPAVGEGRAAGTGYGGDLGEDGRAMPLARARSELEIALIRRALARRDRNIKRTAEDLDISRVTLYRLMDKHGIQSR